MFTFFYFLLENFYFLLYFSKFQKQIRSTNILNESYRLLIVSHKGDHGDIEIPQIWKNPAIFAILNFWKNQTF